MGDLIGHGPACAFCSSARGPASCPARPPVPAKIPLIRSFAYPREYPFRFCVMWTSPGRWAVIQGHRELAVHPTQAEAFADAWARTHPKEEPPC